MTSDEKPYIVFDNFKIYYNDPFDISAIIEVFVLDVYEAKNIDQGDTIIDIGAGIGEFSLLASHRTGSKGKVIAIEPSPDDYATLLMNVKENRCDNVIPLNIAVTDKPMTLELEFKGKRFYSKSDTLDNVLQNLNIERSSVKFIKMDIEGAERQVIPSSIQIIDQVNFLAMEIHNGYQEDLIPIMRRLGFTFSRMSSRKHYLTKSLKVALTHPLATYSLFKTFRKNGEYPGLKKILNGIEISKSDKLVVGTFKRQ